eukprot:3983831-Alexandrium_andersonii.AAC.1
MAFATGSCATALVATRGRPETPAWRGQRASARAAPARPRSRAPAEGARERPGQTPKARPPSTPCAHLDLQ